MTERAPGTAAADPYARLIAKYAEKASRKPEEAKYWTDERMRQMIARVEDWVERRDFEHLRALRFRDLNPFSREVFTTRTGIALPKKQADCLAVIENFVGADAVNAYRTKLREEDEARKLKSLLGRVSSRRYNFEDRTITCKEFIDTIISRGYTILSSKRRGAALQYKISNGEGTSYLLCRRDEYDYAQHRLKQLREEADETKATTAPMITPLERLAQRFKGSTCALKAMLALTKEEADAHPYGYARPGAPLPGILLPLDTHGIIFRTDDGDEDREVLLTSAALDTPTLERLDLFPVNEDARVALAEAVAQDLATDGSIVLAKPGTRHGCALHRSGKYAAFQFTIFDPHGFFSDHEVKSLGDGLNEAVKMGFTEPAQGLLDELVLTDKFTAGNERTAIRNGLLSFDLLHTVIIPTLRYMAPHELTEYLDLFAPDDGTMREDAVAKLEGILRRWDEWDAANPPDPDPNETPYARDNYEALAERLRALSAHTRPHARTREQLIEDLAAEIIRMPETAELVNATPATEAAISIKDQAGELIASLIDDDQPPPHRVDEFNLTWSGDGGTDGFLDEIARRVYTTVYGQLLAAAPGAP